jgi:hypothetical protein
VQFLGDEKRFHTAWAHRRRFLAVPNGAAYWGTPAIGARAECWSRFCGHPPPSARPLKVAKHTKPNSEQKKVDRPAHPVIAKNWFAALETIDEVIAKLVGV